MTQFIAEQLPISGDWSVRDTGANRTGGELQFNGRPTSLLTWKGMSQEVAERIADRYNDGFRPTR